MTQLDEKALEAAKELLSAKWYDPGICDAPPPDVFDQEVRETITAYLDALPPARVAWARPDILETTGLHMVSKWASSFPDSGITQVEIREVRPSPPSVEG